ncbi:pyrroline-5-carboxylate reductase [Oceanobacillus sp. 143]|uniref:Pyrroline-5-carboxylate reductase n=1 Tax=Oceanobacillus zhaokaii TaxID=2052660 RepID=A0A345PFW0_9BACI|nr:pyrroline-5-carboxylate reductase [Oceanobacillus zhaokaii]AXI08890.1 pyrroline-5-carboxylate reductase [Oceanobacillus zhaokaii]QGS68564.1 pyrroline-5-carboxylate reductase [Oceanobacillus sp. 143]
MKRNIGFIGTGNMAKAIIGGIVKSGYTDPHDVYASNRSIAKLIDIKEEYRINVFEDNLSVAENCNIIFLSVTPNVYPDVIEEIRDGIRDDAIVIHIAAGQTIAQSEKHFQRKIKIAKAMPNTPVNVGEGMTSISFNRFVTEEEKEEIRALFESFGKVEFIDESLMDIASAVGGSSPAFVYLFIEALADAAVLYGMPRNNAYKIAAQSVLGSAKMVLESDDHPGKLKDDVCSPGGTTIESVASLEENGFRSAIIDAVKANMEKLKK